MRSLWPPGPGPSIGAAIRWRPTALGGRAGAGQRAPVRWACIAVACAAALVSPAAHGDEAFRYQAHELPPFVHQEGNALEGFAVDLLRELCGRHGLCAQAELFPFSRALLQVAKTDSANSFLLLARCPERETQFKWVGPVFESEVYFFKRRDRPWVLSTLEDLRSVVVGVHRGNRDHTYLAGLGLRNLSSSDTQVMTLRMLASDRIDATPMSEAVFPYAAREAGLDASLFERTSLRLYTSTLYFGFSSKTADEDIDRWQRALNAAKATGRYQSLYHRYFANSPRAQAAALAMTP